MSGKGNAPIYSFLIHCLFHFKPHITIHIDMSIKIGITGEQKVQIFDPSVDAVHAFITQKEDGRYIIEDNNSSTGVFVGSLRIRRKTISSDTPIRLGNYATSIDLLMTPPKNLRIVWAKYMEDKWKINRQASQLGTWRGIAMPIGIVVSGILGTFLKTDSLLLKLGISSIPSILSIITTIVIGKKLERIQKENVGKMVELNNKFKNEYVCPKCHHFLGFDTP